MEKVSTAAAMQTKNFRDQQLTPTGRRCRARCRTGPRRWHRQHGDGEPLAVAGNARDGFGLGVSL